MQAVILAHFGALGDAVRATAIHADRKNSAAWCIRQLPALYARLSETADSRYDDEITRLLQGLLADLAHGGCPAAQKLAAGIPAGLRLLHARLGLPGVSLKPPAPPPRPRKAHKSNEEK